jgi:hypothetical protein
LNSRKKDVLLKEVFERNGVIAKTERRCFYFIKEITHLEGSGDLQQWVDTKESSDGNNMRHFHIMKIHNDMIGEDKIICKIAGTFYAVVNRNVYTIAFMHSFKARFMRATFEK